MFFFPLTLNNESRGRSSDLFPFRFPSHSEWGTVDKARPKSVMKLQQWICSGFTPIPFSLPDETTIRQLHAIFTWRQRYINHFIREMIFCECLLVHRDGGNTLCWTVILGKTFRISLKSGFYPCTGNEVKPVLNGKHVKPIISMMKTRWIISFARLPVSVKNPNAPLSKGISCRSWSVRIIAISRFGN